MNPESRIGWLDAAKGAGIILVVAGHALGGAIDATPGQAPEISRQILFIVYTFHMPLFFMLSGLLVTERLGRNPQRFRQSLLSGIIWPYFLWSVVQVTIVAMLGSLVNNPEHNYWGTLIALPLNPVAQFWFLYSLLLLHLLSMATLPRFGPTGFLIICLLLQSVAAMQAMPNAFRLTAIHAPYYALGVFLGARGLENLVVTRPAWGRVLLLPAIAAALAAQTLLMAEANLRQAFPTASSPELVKYAWTVAAMPAAIGGSLAVIGLVSLSRGWLHRALSHLGARTMAIFLLHLFAVAGARIVLMKVFGVTDILILAPWLLFVGIAGPLMADALLRRVQLTRALGLA